MIQISSPLQTIFKFLRLLISALIKGLCTNGGIYSTFSMKMYLYIVHDSSAPEEEFLKSNFKFSRLLIWGLIKGLIPN